MRSHLPNGKIPGSWRMNWSWTRRRPGFQLEQTSIGFQVRDGDDTKTKLVAVRVKGDIQEMGFMELDGQLDDDMRKGKRVCTLSSAVGCWITVLVTEIRDPISRAVWVKMMISVWDSLNWSFYRVVQLTVG